MLQTRWLLVSTGLASLFLLPQCSPATGGGGNEASGGKILSMGGSMDPGSGGQAGIQGTGGKGGAAGNQGSGGKGGAAGMQGSGGKGGAAGNGSGGSGAGGAGSGGTRVDCKGQALAKAGDKTSVSKAYLNLGEMRLINNRWGSDELGCTGTQQSVFVNSDKTLGWTFNRPTCGGNKGKPDYPEIEFGVAPFGATSPLLTTPACSSTTLLPIQLKSLTSASITLNSFNVSFTNPSIWNMDFEVWLSRENPVTSANPGVFAEIITFWGWENGRWPCNISNPPTVSSGSNSYRICHQSDTWANGQWRFYNFNVDGGPYQTVNGKVDVKAFIDKVVSSYGLSTDLWLTRIEVGTEIDDNTAGSVKINGITFEVNGASRSPEFGN